MISVHQIYNTAEEHQLNVTNIWATSSKGRKPAELLKITVFFHGQCAEAWAFLMSDVTEVPVEVFGTRQVTSSGATDNTLYPVYHALLPEINAKRAAAGLKDIHN